MVYHSNCKVGHLIFKKYNNFYNITDTFILWKYMQKCNKNKFLLITYIFLHFLRYFHVFYNINVSIIVYKLFYFLQIKCKTFKLKWETMLYNTLYRLFTLIRNEIILIIFISQVIFTNFEVLYLKVMSFIYRTTFIFPKLSA